MLVLLATLAVAPGPSSPDDARQVVRAAAAAVAGDSVASVRERWEAARRRNPPDAAALLGLASLARFTNDYAAADTLHERLAVVQRGTTWKVYAVLGRAEGLAARAPLDSAIAVFERGAALARTPGDRAALAAAAHRRPVGGRRGRARAGTGAGHG